MNNLTVENLVLTFGDIKADRWLSAWICVKACKLCIHLWNEEYPNDSNLDNGICAIEKWLAHQSDDNVALVKKHSKIVDETAVDVGLFYRGEGYIVAMIDLILSTCEIVTDEQFFPTAAEATHAVIDILTDSKLCSSYGEACFSVLNENLEAIISYKILNNQKFGNFEKVFNAASEADRQRLLFHLDLNNA